MQGIQIKTKIAKGPNPLSIKKKQIKIQEKNTEPKRKRIRKRNKKESTKDVSRDVDSWGIKCVYYYKEDALPTFWGTGYLYNVEDGVILRKSDPDVAILRCSSKKKVVWVIKHG